MNEVCSEIHSLNNTYFNSNDSNCEDVLAGSTHEKEFLLPNIKVNSKREETSIEVS